MKKLVLFLVLLISLFVQAKTYTAIQNFTTAECVAGTTKSIINSPLDELWSITIDSTGVDTSFDITLYETIDGVSYAIPGGIFTLTSVSEPYVGLVIQSFDIDSNVGLGYPTDNPISVSISNAAGLTACKVILKYRKTVSNNSMYGG